MTDEVRIRTTTLNEVKRFFLFVFSCLLYNLWKFANLFLKTKVSFATFVYVLSKTIEERLEKKKEPPDQIKQLKMILSETVSS